MILNICQTARCSLFLGLLLVASANIGYGQTIKEMPKTPPTVAPNPADDVDDDESDSSDEETWRGELSLGDIEDKTKQDAVIALITQRQKRLLPLKKDVNTLSELVASATSTDAQIEDQLAQVRAALQHEHDGRIAEAEELDAKISFSRDAHLEKTLVFLGIIGDEAAIMNSISVALGSLGAHSLNRSLTYFRVVDPQTKGVLGAFVHQLSQAIQPSAEWAGDNNPLFQGYEAGATQEQWRQYLDTFRQKVANINTQRQAGLARLDTKLGYTRNPRLNAIVFLTGISDTNITLLTPLTSDGDDDFLQSNDLVTGKKKPL